MLVELRAAGRVKPLAPTPAPASASRQRRQADLEAGFVPEQARERDLAAGFVDVAAHQGHAGAVLRIARRTFERGVAGLENEFDRLPIAQARGGLAGDHAFGDGSGADLIGVEAAAVIVESKFEALLGQGLEFQIAGCRAAACPSPARSAGVSMPCITNCE